MAAKFGKHLSPRHGFAFDEVPTIKGSMYGGGGVILAYPEQYGPRLDCIYEMADDISSANGVSVGAAIDQVLKDEGWRILPKHRKAIIARLT